MESPDSPSASPRKQGLFAVCFIMVLAGLLFTPWLVTGRVLAPFDIVQQMFLPWRSDVKVPEVHNHFVTDAVSQYIPYRMFAEQSFREDGYIGWNPLVFGGTPQYANTMGLYFDWTMQLHRFLSFWNAWHLGIYLQFVLAGTGMFFFLRSSGCSPPIAMMGALAYMTNWQFVAWVYHRWALGSFCWVPWALWAMVPWLSARQPLASARRKSSLRFAAVPVFLALGFTGGTLQHAAFIVIACLCVFLGSCLDGLRNTQSILRQFGRFAAWGALAVGLAGIAFLPTIQAFLDNSTVGHGRGGLSYDSGPGQPLLNASSYLFYFFPFVLGTPNALDFWKILSSDLFNVGFFGTIPMILAVLALFHRNVPAAPKFLILAGLLIPLTPLVGLLYHRVNLLWILGGCWAAAEFLERSSPGEIVSVAKRIAWCFGLVSGLWIFAGAVMRGVYPQILDSLTAEVLLRANTAQFGQFTEWMILRAAKAADWLFATNPIQFIALGSAFVAAWGLCFIKQSTNRSFTPAVAVFFQTSLFWWMWTTWSPSEPGYRLPDSTAVFDSLRNGGRIAQGQKGVAATPFPPNTLSVLGVATTGAYDSIHPLQMTTDDQIPWSFPGTTHYLAPFDSPSPVGWQFLASDFDGQLFRNPNPDPVFMATGRVPGTNPSDPLFSAPLTPSLRTNNRIVLDLPPGTREIRILENWNPGWRFRTGEQEPWHPVNMAENRSMLVLLPADGDSPRVTVQFFPFTSPIGPSLSLLSAMIIIVVAVAGRRQLGEASV